MAQTVSCSVMCFCLIAMVNILLPFYSQNTDICGLKISRVFFQTIYCCFSPSCNGQWTHRRPHIQPAMLQMFGPALSTSSGNGGGLPLNRRAPSSRSAGRNCALWGLTSKCLSTTVGMSSLQIALPSLQGSRHATNSHQLLTPRFKTKQDFRVLVERENI